MPEIIEVARNHRNQSGLFTVASFFVATLYVLVVVCTATLVAGL